MEAVGLRLPVGSTVIVSEAGGQTVEAEVVGFQGDRLFLMPYSEPFGLMPGASVWASEDLLPCPQYGKPNHPWRRTEDRTRMLPVGNGLLGRVVDANGQPLDRLGALECRERRPLRSRPINPIDRAPVEKALDVGVRALNGLLTIGRGQRIGLFAGTGVGKSVLLGMMAKYTEAQRVHRTNSGARWPEKIGRCCGTGRYSALAKTPRRCLCHRHRRVFQRSRATRIALIGLAYPLCDGAT
jgi:flagellum-specific ATP synthase